MSLPAAWQHRILILHLSAAYVQSQLCCIFQTAHVVAGGMHISAPVDDGGIWKMLRQGFTVSITTGSMDSDSNRTW